MGASAYTLAGVTSGNLVTSNDWSTRTYTINVGNGGVVSPSWEPNVAVDTDLAWLDRRVDEMRVRL